MLRAATPADVEALSGLITEVAPPTFAGARPIENLARWLSAHASTDAVAAKVHDESLSLLVAESPTEGLVGTGYLGAESPSHPAVGYIGGIYCRITRQGMGSSILRALLSTSRDRGMSSVKLDVGADNRPMRRFVESHGFRVIGDYLDPVYFTETRFVSYELALSS
jgi:RimJ/RimL family protein N-acetyltransferase